MLIGKSKFLSYQKVFHQKVISTPYKIELEVVSIKARENPDEFSMEEFVGDQTRESKLYTLRCLYEKDISDRTREKYGLPKEVNGVIYLSPRQLVPLFGDYHLDWNRTKIHFEGSVQLINKVVYLEDLKEYGSCVGIQIFIRDSLKGG